MRINLVSLIDTVIWGFFSFTGFSLLAGVIAQHVPGYPNVDQIAYYVVLPCALLFFSLGILLTSMKIDLHPLAELLAWLLLVGFIPFILPYTGGV